MLEFRGVTKKYGCITALSNISFNVYPGEIVGLIGANGAGKTTAMRLISRFISPDEGDIFISGINTNSISAEQYAVSYIPDEPVYYEFMTVSEHFHFIQTLYSHNEYNADELIMRFSLADQMKKTPNMLSKGNKQKLMICTALLRKFDYLIADEPFTGLDPKQIMVFKKILEELREKEKAILLSTHLLNMVEQFCDRYIMIDKGMIVAYGSREEIAQTVGLDPKSNIEELYVYLTNHGYTEYHEE
ncbi:MAG TPA: ABC transporter ATP-binding protein [Gallicola sp.]|nr:ABC transporter ATP-binding protein [Gallicola sp.]